MISWFKSHWKIIAGIAVGIPVLYWLYQQYAANAATNAANSQTAAQQAALDNAEQAQNEQSALSSLTGGGSPGGQDTPGNSITTTPTATSTSPTTTTPAAAISSSNLYAGTTGEYSTEPTAGGDYTSISQVGAPDTIGESVTIQGQLYTNQGGQWVSGTGGTAGSVPTGPTGSNPAPVSSTPAAPVSPSTPVTSLFGKRPSTGIMGPSRSVSATGSTAGDTVNTSSPVKVAIGGPASKPALPTRTPSLPGNPFR